MSELADYDYELPPELIAQEPSKDRAGARLLVVNIKEGRIEHADVADLPDMLLPDDVMVVNNTRVVAARLVGQRVSTGGKWQGLFLERDGDGLGKLLSKTRGKLHPGEVIRLIDTEGRPGREVVMVAKLDGGAWVVRPRDGRDTGRMKRWFQGRSTRYWTNCRAAYRGRATGNRQVPWMPGCPRRSAYRQPSRPRAG